ncbi:hypothetical protein [Sphingomonas sp. PAMC 26621]|uniref:hypothetical protein n=1 Tax=Sphingomonas sp. PAMC 26621 TaxID=1112213 RepID=UPI0002892CC5|nr:hypothetical protein [Sphingomonas sp. PAMC 26621]
MIRAMPPPQGTNSADARAALASCGITPDSIAWSVSPEGTFVFGRKSADAPPLPEKQSECLMRWIEKGGIKVGVIGWETGPR